MGVERSLYKLLRPFLEITTGSKELVLLVKMIVLPLTKVAFVILRV